MERKIMNDFLRWKKDMNRKPLLLYGNRQIGKTYSVLAFGEKEYKTVAYINCENNYELLSIAKRENSVEKIVLRLALLVGEPILKKDTLIVFDNVNDLDIVKMVKLFGKGECDYHVIMITSLKENLVKFKGEELQYKYMFPVDFEEYLKACNQNQLIDFIKDSYKNNKTIPFHQIAMDHFQNYLMTGGLPEAIEASFHNPNFAYLNSVHQKMIDCYKRSLLFMPTLIDMTRANEVLDIMPYQFLKPNHKFQYGLMREGSRSKDYEAAIDFLSNNNFVYRCYKVSNVGMPLSKFKDKDSFKLYPSDTGILFYQLHLNQIKLLQDDKLKNILYETSIANNIVSSGYNLYYYASEGKAEVSFIVQSRLGKIVPIELVNTNLSKAKSLTLFMNKYDIHEAIRVSEENFSLKKGIKYIPIYATFCFKEYL